MMFVSKRFALISFLLHATAIASSTTHPESTRHSDVVVTHLPAGKECTVYPKGGTKSDVANILKAVSICGTDGKIVFPEGMDYYIASKLNPVLKNATIEWRGTWTMSPDIEYWQQPQNTYPISFQNHAAGIVFTGDGISIDGYGTGGIYGNGDVWYTFDAGNTTAGRPMPFVFWNVSQVTVNDFFVRQPPLWSLNIMNGTNLYFNNIECNATSTKAPYGENWVQNTDGFDTMNVENVHLTNFVYQGGDDCVAIKPQSYNVYVQNATCHGGNGMAIGSLGQYLSDATVENVVMDNVTVIRHNDDLTNSAYLKTWIGVPTLQPGSYESCCEPRGGGWGSVRNILFSNFLVMGADAGPSISEDSGDNGSFPGTSLMGISDVSFVNFTGYLSGNEKATQAETVSCSNVHPCYNIAYDNVTLTLNENTTATGSGQCSYISPGGVHGLTGDGC